MRSVYFGYRRSFKQQNRRYRTESRQTILHKQIIVLGDEAHYIANRRMLQNRYHSLSFSLSVFPRQSTSLHLIATTHPNKAISAYTRHFLRIRPLLRRQAYKTYLGHLVITSARIFLCSPNTWPVAHKRLRHGIAIYDTPLSICSIEGAARGVLVHPSDRVRG